MSDSGQQMTTEHRVSLRASIAPQPGHLDVSPIMFLTRGTVTALLDDADALAAALAEVERLSDRLTLARTPCQCDPPGSGEEYCTGHCELNAEIVRLREWLSRIADFTQEAARNSALAIEDYAEAVAKSYQFARAALAPADGSGEEAKQ